MPRNLSLLTRALPLGVLWLLGWVHPAPAQVKSSFPDNPYQTVVVTTPSPYWGYTYDPYGGILRGAADLTRAQGQYLILREQATQARVQTQQLKRESRRKEIEQWYWEREYKAAMREKEAVRDLASAIKTARTDPSLTEILSGQALNLLLHEMVKEARPPQGKSVTVSAEWLGHINTTFLKSGAGGNVGLLKREVVPWSLLLRRTDFAANRDRVEQLLNQAREEALKGGAAVDTLVDLRKELSQLQGKVDLEMRASADVLWTPSDFVRASRSLRELRAAADMLQREDAKFYLNPLQGNDVTALLQYMKTNGLSFAPATTGSERYYIILHRALAEEYNNLHPVSSPGKN